MDRTTKGWVSGMLGVLIFSGSLPATRVAVLQFDPFFLTVARASVAGLLGVLLLGFMGVKLPRRDQLVPLVVVALGVVVGFPLLTALSLQHVTSAHSIVFIGLLPLSTAIFGVIRDGERPRQAFWVLSLIASAIVVGFGFSKGLEASWAGDTLMLAAIVVCGLGYAEGGRLSRSLGGWQVICWALVISLPVMLAMTALLWPQNLADIKLPAWLGLGYVSLFSMLIGFVFWYRGLAAGGIASVGQLQYLQPFFGFGLAALFLREPITWQMLAASVAVILCVITARRLAKGRAKDVSTVGAVPLRY